MHFVNHCFIKYTVACMLLAGSVAAGTKNTIKINPVIDSFPVSLSFATEMSYLPEVDSWDTYSDSSNFLDSQKVAKSWAKISPWVQRRCTVTLLTGLSRWAQVQTSRMKQMPSLEKSIFSPSNISPDRKRIVFKSIVDTLPSHAPLVKRYLILYLLYDSDTGLLIRTTITIRGERKE